MSPRSDNLPQQILSDSHSNRLVVYLGRRLLKILVDLVEPQALVNHKLKHNGACQVSQLLAVRLKGSAVLEIMLQVGSNLRPLVLEHSKHSNPAACGALQRKVAPRLDNSLNKQFQALVNQLLRVVLASNLALCHKIKAPFRVCPQELRLLLVPLEIHHKRHKLRAKVFIRSKCTTRPK